VYRAAERYSGLTPTHAQVRADLEVPLRQKAGVELDQGVFLSQVLSCSRAGAHLIHAMLRPRAESEERLAEFRRTGAVDLGTAYVQRDGNVGWLYLRNTRFLNAEDDTTLEALETGVDLVLLDPEIEAGVLRGATVDHPRYAGRHVFNAGLNLTRLYQGQLSYLFCITRELGLVSKLYRGLTGPEFYPREPEATLEKPWIGAVEAFAIGGGCQLMLVLDYVVAETGSFFNLPAPKEGLIPGVANLRLTRFVGDRLARQGIFFDRQFPADSPEGRLLCDEVVPPEAIMPAVRAAVERLVGSGMVSTSANRKALRVGHEPLSALQAYMALYAREQAYAYFSAGLVHNLEANWVARKRSG
ncbi:MAG: enoyl-CoA hydratase/isomerase family protein, partial [Chloroflexi bacterium]|nr:enoyl-CoA hydratase/isomerase family protein [Chloroflexota bacterium]